MFNINNLFKKKEKRLVCSICGIECRYDNKVGICSTNPECAKAYGRVSNAKWWKKHKQRMAEDPEYKKDYNRRKVEAKKRRASGIYLRPRRKQPA